MIFTRSYGHDLLGRRTRHTNPSGTTSSWSYDAAGNPARLTTGGRAIAFDLDPPGRVTAVRARDWSERYAFDEAGNQTDASWPTSHPAPAVSFEVVEDLRVGGPPGRGVEGDGGALRVSPMFSSSGVNPSRPPVRLPPAPESRPRGGCGTRWW
ncbi:hypothetical protein GCM10011579_010990 [Streptomyces albiflavescens]|uniref:Uncharacterized protein n=1 Tax=Streptomyces albiflavescens TaxID=1623582 RepID=A0A917XV90_9ACTN|nr:RHS repeat domain-containing protein [Streptomyces albiflavescens]GGN53156.1 hypothetical protein GCM10011579_010990 [Streptomyces albiflavescens]